MAALKRTAIFLLALTSTPATAQDASRWRPYIAEASSRFGIPVSWIERVMMAESRGRTTLAGRPIVSPVGAMGLMQLMPGTWSEMRTKLGLGANPHDPRDNILAGTLYLRLMYDRFGYPGLFGAYNAGPMRYAEHVARGRSLPAETRAYVAIVSGEADQPGLAAPRHVDRGIFFRLGDMARRRQGADSASASSVLSRRSELWFVSND